MGRFNGSIVILNRLTNVLLPARRSDQLIRGVLYCIIVILAMVVSLLFPEQGSQPTVFTVPLPMGGQTFLRRYASGSRPSSLDH